MQLLKFNTENNLYVPVFTTFKIDLPKKKINYFFLVDAGYGVHSFQSSFTDTFNNGTFKIDSKNTGGLYLATGAGIKLKGKAAPYFNLQYSLYGFKFETISNNLSGPAKSFYSQRNTAKGITICAGIFLHNKLTKQKSHS